MFGFEVSDDEQFCHRILHLDGTPMHLPRHNIRGHQ